MSYLPDLWRRRAAILRKNYPKWNPDDVVSRVLEACAEDLEEMEKLNEQSVEK